MGRKTGPFLGGVFLPDDATIAPPIDPNMTSADLVAKIEAEMQEPCEDCGDAIIDCECGAQWLGETEQ